MDHELKRQLQSLACGKFKVLKKHPHGKEVNDDDSFSFNNDFSSTITKIKIATVSSKIESKEERKETHDRIEEERKYLLDVSDDFAFLNFQSFLTVISGMHCSYYEGQKTYDAY